MTRLDRGPTLYNPRELEKDELVKSFVARRALLERLVQFVRQDSGRSIGQHHVVVGRPGMGKTTLLHRLRYAIEDDPALSSEWLPVTFREEQFNVDRLSKLFVNCIDALSDRLEDLGLHDRAMHLDTEVDGLPANESDRAEAAQALLLHAARDLGKRLVLLIDNLSLVLERLSDAEGWRLRALLSAEDRILLIGASPAADLFEKYGQPFYDVIRPHEIEPLGVQEMRTMIEQMARAYGHPEVLEPLEREPSRLRTLHVLAGGNPRIAVLLYQVLAVRREGSFEDHLARALDLITSFYRSRLEELAPQAQVLVDAIAIHWDPLTAGELAELVRVDVNTVSSQLNRLARAGLVERLPSDPPTKTGFQLAERFFNVWYVMRCASRRVRRRLGWLIDVLHWFYGSEGIATLARRHLAQGFGTAPGDLGLQVEDTLFLACCVEEPSLRRALEARSVEMLVKSGMGVEAYLDLERAEAHLRPVVDAANKAKELSELLAGLARDHGETEARLSALLTGSLSLDLDGKLRIARRLGVMTPRGRADLVRQLSRERELVEKVAGRAACEALDAAFREGLLAAPTDVEGADAAAVALERPILGLVARALDALRDPTESSVSRLADGLREGREALPLCWAALALGEERLGREQSSGATGEHFESSAWQTLGDLLVLHLRWFDAAERALRRWVAIARGEEKTTAMVGLAHTLAMAGRADAALAAARKAVELDESSAAAWALVAGCLSECGEAPAALEAARRALQLDGGDPSRWISLSDHLQRAGELGPALEAAERAIELGEGSARPWVRLGEAHEALEHFDQAEQAYARAAAVEPDTTFALSRLARLYESRGRADDELRAREQATTRAWADDVDWWFFGHALRSRGRYLEAEKAARRGLELNDRTAWSWYLLGLLLHDQGRIEEAESALRRAVGCSDADAYNWTMLAIALLLQGKLEEAEVAARKAVEHAAAPSTAWWLLGLIVLRHDRHEEAERAQRRALEVDPNNAYAMGELGTALLFGGRLADAAALLSSALERLPTNEYFWGRLGDAHLQLKRFSDAEFAFRRAMELGLDAAAAGRARVYIAQGNFQEAVRTCEEAIQRAPRIAAIWIWYASALQGLGRLDEAEAVYRRAIDALPESAELHDAFAWFRYCRGSVDQETERLARRSLEIAPTHPSAQHTAATVLARLGRWREAALLAEKLLVSGNERFFAAQFSSILLFFREAISAGRAREARELLRETGFDELWRPLAAALEAVERGSTLPLRRVAPEVRQPALEMLKILLPDRELPEPRTKSEAKALRSTPARRGRRRGARRT